MAEGDEDATMNWSFADLAATAGRYVLLLQMTDLLDIAIMAFLLYHLFVLVQSTKAASLLKGLLVFLAALALSTALRLHSINFIMSKMVDWGALALVILFQPELRRILEQMGSRRVFCKGRGQQHHGADHFPDRAGLFGNVSEPHRRTDRL